jgi:hypothetical protein
MMRTFTLRGAAAALATVVALAGCGGGGSDGGPAQQRSVGGSVSGLVGSGLVLQNNGGDDLAVTANGAFTFSTLVAQGAPYAVTVKTQPSSPTQTCIVTNGTGTVGAAEVTNVAVSCSTSAPTFTIGGAVAGLTGSGLVLQNNGAGDLAISANGPFTFATSSQTGAAYAVTVKTQPSGQTCSVANGSGTVGTANVTNVAVTCTAGVASFTVGGTVAGLSGGSIVLQNNGGDDMSLATSGPFTFGAAVPTGSAYAVTVKSKPASQSCVVANGTGTMGTAPVTNVTVTCTNNPPNTFAVGGTVSGLGAGKSVVLSNAGVNTTVATNGSYTLSTPVATGAAYAVTVATQPLGQNCSVANGSGTMGAAAVTNVNVTCTTNTYTVGGSIAGLVGTGLVLHSDVGTGEDLTIPANATTFVFTQKAASGSTVNVTVKTQPSSPAETCAVAGSPVTIGTADVSSIAVSCTTAIQRWAAPTSWGARWPDSPTMVHHAYFEANGIVETKGIQLQLEGSPAPALRELGAFPAPRFGAGPFSASHYEATGGDSALDLSGDMLACAVVKPDYNPVTEGTDPVILAKGFDRNHPSKAGWVLIQRHHMFNFQYHYADGLGNGFAKMAYAPSYFADESQRDNGPLNPTYVVVCAGRDGDELRLAANSFLPDGTLFAGTEDTTIPIAGAPLYTGSPVRPLTLGGYSDGSADHAYGGRIYETAVWNEAATPANIQAKLAAFVGVPEGAQYTRNREAPFVGVDGKLHTAWRHAPRIYQANGAGLDGGFLFGLQGWNRLTRIYDHVAAGDPSQQNPVIALGEDLAHDLWIRTGGATAVARQLEPPGDSEQPTAARVTLPPGASLSTQLGQFDNAGPIHGMIWIRPVSATGTLAVATSQPDVTASSNHVIDLAQLDAGAWNHVWLSGLTTDASATAATVSLTNSGAAEIEFYAWGMDLTQIGRGGDLGAFNPGPIMYDWGGSFDGGNFALDVLQLPAMSGTAAGAGFCLTVDAQPPAGLAWSALFEADRAPVTWIGSNGLDQVNVFLAGKRNAGATPGDLCAHVSTLGETICWTPTWAPGTKHTIGVCSSPTGNMRLYADGVSVGTPVNGAGTPPDIAAGRLLVGSNRTVGAGNLATWQGFISRVAACASDAVSACR